MDLQDKTVLDTASTRGIGLAIAKAFYSRGCNIVLNSRHAIPEELLKQFSDNNRVFSAIGDVANEKEAQYIVEQTIEHFHQIDVLVNNAGINRDMLANRMSSEDFQAPIKTNLIGSFNVTQPALKTMYHQKRGSIINISSVVALIGNIGQLNYAASKAGLIGLTKTLAREAARRHVRCNAIAPGMISTDMVSALAEKNQEQLKKQIPLGDFGSPDEVAQAAVFLAENDYVTGQVITIDGGLSMA